MVTLSRTKSQYERIEMPEDSSFAWKNIADTHFTAPFHHHPEIELTLITEGHGQRFIGDTVEAFHAGDVALIGPHLPHAWFSEASCEKSTAIVVQFHAETFGGGVLKAQELESVRALLAEAAGGVIIKPMMVASMQPRLAELEVLSPVRRLALLLEVLEQVALSKQYRCLNAKAPEQTVSLVDRQRLGEVLRFLHENHRQSLSLQDVAKVAGLGPESFSRFFRRVTGHTFIETLIQIRLASAQVLLAESAETIASVAFACGFEDLSNFNRQFRRAYGITPSEARRRASLGSSAL